MVYPYSVSLVPTFTQTSFISELQQKLLVLELWADNIELKLPLTKICLQQNTWQICTFVYSYNCLHISAAANTSLISYVVYKIWISTGLPVNLHHLIIWIYTIFHLFVLSGTVPLNNFTPFFTCLSLFNTYVHAAMHTYTPYILYSIHFHLIHYNLMFCMDFIFTYFMTLPWHYLLEVFSSMLSSWLSHCRLFEMKEAFRGLYCHKMSLLLCLLHNDVFLCCWRLYKVPSKLYTEQAT